MNAIYTGTRRLSRAAAVFRCLLEAAAVVIILSWSSTRVPPAIALSTAVLRRLPAVLLQPISVFLLGNAIVLALFAQSGQSAEGRPPPQTASPSPAAVVGGRLDGDADDNYLTHPPPELPWEGKQGVIWEGKSVCTDRITAATVVTTCYSTSTTATSTSTTEELVGGVTSRGEEENYLLQSHTDHVCTCERKLAEVTEEENEEVTVAEYEEEEDGDEFRRRIEAFIVKQLRFIQREEESLLLQASSI